jgi:hypothetical protein
MSEVTMDRAEEMLAQSEIAYEASLVGAFVMYEKIYGFLRIVAEQEEEDADNPGNLDSQAVLDDLMGYVSGGFIACELVRSSVKSGVPLQGIMYMVESNMTALQALITTNQVPPQETN